MHLVALWSFSPGNKQSLRLQFMSVYLRPDKPAESMYFLIKNVDLQSVNPLSFALLLCFCYYRIPKMKTLLHGMISYSVVTLVRNPGGTKSHLTKI